MVVMEPKCALLSLAYQFGGLDIILRRLFLSSAWFLVRVGLLVAPSAPRGMLVEALRECSPSQFSWSVALPLLGVG